LEDLGIFKEEMTGRIYVSTAKKSSKLNKITSQPDPGCLRTSLIPPEEKKRNDEHAQVALQGAKLAEQRNAAAEAEFIRREDYQYPTAWSEWAYDSSYQREFRYYLTGPGPCKLSLSCLMPVPR